MVAGHVFNGILLDMWFVILWLFFFFLISDSFPLHLLLSLSFLDLIFIYSLLSLSLSQQNSSAYYLITVIVVEHRWWLWFYLLIQNKLNICSVLYTFFWYFDYMLLTYCCMPYVTWNFFLMWYVKFHILYEPYSSHFVTLFKVDFLENYFLVGTKIMVVQFNLYQSLLTKWVKGIWLISERNFYTLN